MLESLLEETLDSDASDLYLKPERPPLLRIAGRIVPTERDALESRQIEEIVLALLSPKKKEELKNRGQVDFAYLLSNKARFRMNAFRAHGMWNLVCRKIPLKIPSLDELDLPPVIKDVLTKRQGFILVTGPTGSGKSTTLAAMVDYLNSHQQCHIITIEDPIEYVYEDKLAIIHQREIGDDVTDFHEALRGALRQDPDVLLIGEMRDQESVAMAMMAAETGHLVLSTLHTNDATQTIDRILDLFPEQILGQIRLQLSLTLLAIFSQRLAIRSDNSGRIAILEVMINSPAIQSLIQEGKTKEMKRIIAQSQDLYRMQTLNQALVTKIEEGKITQEEARRVSPEPKELDMLLKGLKSSLAAGSVHFHDGDFV